MRLTRSLSHRHFIAFDIKPFAGSAIVGLIPDTLPSAVLRTVRSIVVNPAKSQPIGPWPHVGVEVDELPPTLAKCDSPSSVTGIGGVPGISAPTDQPTPDAIFIGVAHAMDVVGFMIIHYPAFHAAVNTARDFKQPPTPHRGAGAPEYSNSDFAPWAVNDRLNFLNKRDSVLENGTGGENFSGRHGDIPVVALLRSPAVNQHQWGSLLLLKPLHPCQTPSLIAICEARRSLTLTSPPLSNPDPNATDHPMNPCAISD